MSDARLNSCTVVTCQVEQRVGFYARWAALQNLALDCACNCAFCSANGSENVDALCTLLSSALLDSPGEVHRRVRRAQDQVSGRSEAGVSGRLRHVAGQLRVPKIRREHCVSLLRSNDALLCLPCPRARPPRLGSAARALRRAPIGAEARFCTSTKTTARTLSASQSPASMAARTSGYERHSQCRIRPSVAPPLPLPRSPRGVPPRHISHGPRRGELPDPSRRVMQEASPPFSLSGSYIMMVDRGPGMSARRLVLCQHESSRGIGRP